MAIHHYGYKPTPQFFRSDEERTNGRDVYFGIELEIVFRGAGQRERFDVKLQEEGLASRIYLKEDGSLGGRGVEIVSFPMTLIEHQNYGWERIVEIAEELGARSHDDERCGLHVHMSRNWFSTGDIKKVMAFYDMNFAKLHRGISRRKHVGRIERYCKHYGIKDLSTVEGRRRKLNKMYRRHTWGSREWGRDRMHGVNITNEKTVEFRFQQGTLKYESLMAAIELVDKMARWSHRQTIDFMLKDDGTMDEFIKHAMEVDYYVYLKSYLKERAEVSRGMEWARNIIRETESV